MDIDIKEALCSSQVSDKPDICTGNDNIVELSCDLTWCNISDCDPLKLSEAQCEKLRLQDSRGLLSEFHKNKLEQQAAINWDKFYKRNETRFFKDRHWTTREFTDLLKLTEDCQSSEAAQHTLLEIGCGVGNLLYPLLEECRTNLHVFACDFSPRAVDMVKSNPRYDPLAITAFVADITKDDAFTDHLPRSGVDLITCIFVLSTVSPERHLAVLNTMTSVCKPGTVLLFRDYAINDMSMIRYKPGSKIADRFYMRQDGTRTFYFTKGELNSLFAAAGFVCKESRYIHNVNTNVKEGKVMERLFLQGKYVYSPSMQMET